MHPARNPKDVLCGPQAEMSAQPYFDVSKAGVMEMAMCSKPTYNSQQHIPSWQDSAIKIRPKRAIYNSKYYSLF